MFRRKKVISFSEMTFQIVLVSPGIMHKRCPPKTTGVAAEVGLVDAAANGYAATLHEDGAENEACEAAVVVAVV